MRASIGATHTPAGSIHPPNIIELCYVFRVRSSGICTKTVFHRIEMNAHRTKIHFLLVICIGLLPVFNLSASEISHQHSMPMECVDCDSMVMSPESSCIGEICPSISPLCATQVFAGFLPALIAEPGDLAFRSIMRPPIEHRFKSRTLRAIYRPPIS